MTIKADIQSLDPGALVEFYVLDLTSLGGSIGRYHNGINELGNDVVWQGNTYSRFPIKAGGFAESSSGTLPRPKALISNMGGIIGALARQYEGFIGAKFTRKRTFLKYLDAANFASGNPTADANVYFDDEVYFVDRKSHEDKETIEFELASAWDVSGVKLPRGRVTRNVCRWKYRGAECGYAGGAVADINDVPTSDPNVDQCGKRLSSCELRFTGQLPYGGFPNVQR